MDVVFNINRLGMQGLGATLVSLARNCSRTSGMVLNFLCADLTAKDKRNIEHALEAEKYEGRVRFIDFDAAREFGHLRSLHGDWTTYGRLLIPDRIDASQVLYLDADLAINLDLMDMVPLAPPQAQVFAAVSDCTIAWTIDQGFLRDTVGLADDTPYFNAGVMVFNLDECRRRDAARSWRDFAAQYKDHLISHDQTVLNAYARGEFMNMPVRFNLPWPASYRQAPSGAPSSIVHFTGAPKPWDFAGKWLHPGHACWDGYNTPFWQAAYGGQMKGKLGRTWRIRRSIAKALRTRLTPAQA